jgi:hypothetical protein
MMSAVVMVNLMMFMVVARCFMMMSLRCVMLWCRRAPYRLMPWGGFRGVAFAAARSGHRRGAERETRESENRKFFECLVHGAPSLSFFCFADPIAAYAMQGMERRIF